MTPQQQAQPKSLPAQPQLVEPIQQSQPVQQAQWYEGGTLHKATAREWLAATSANRLATAADFAATALKQEGKVARDMADLRVRAEAIESCVSQVAGAQGAENQPVSGLAAACVILANDR
jgi:hypothetical protein